MAHATLYPPAERSQWYGSGNATVAPTAVLWHSTETPGGWPAYGGGANAPTLTYEPWQHRWRQHFPLNGTARALKNGPGYSTNRMAVCQVEISCYCDPARFHTGKGIDRLDDQAFRDMAEFAAFMRVEWGVPMIATGLAFRRYPASYGGGNRISPAAFGPFAGHCGHQHAPYNDHGDPGDFPIARIIGTGDRPLIPTIEDDDDDMHMIFSPGRGNFLVAPGYVNGPLGTQEFVDAMAGLIGRPVKICNDREVDVIRAVLLQGEAAPDDNVRAVMDAVKGG